MNRLILTLLSLGSLISVFSQDKSEVKKDTTPEKREFTISAEFRPRTEYRNGYRQLRSDTSQAAFFTEQRSRIYLNYKSNRLIFHTSIQDIRTWGEQDPRSTSGTLQIFEAYVEPTLTKRISVRIGKQKIIYDNQRLFAQNNWRQNGGTHDAARFMYRGNKLEADLIGAFNQEQGSQDKYFETDFSPAFANYKELFASFIKYKPKDKFIITLINATDGFQSAKNARVDYYRVTSGGRLEYKGERLYLTTAAYYQYGHTSAGQKLEAFYIQPEVKYTFKKYLTLQLGAEIFSGDNGLKPSKVSHSFDALYGVNHAFLGSMDFFTRFPKDFNNAGIIAPYWFTYIDITKKLTFRTDEHLFYSQNNFVQAGVTVDKFLCFENDLLLIYKPNTTTELQLGYSWAHTTKSMEYIKKGGNSSLWQSWAFLMITFKPELFKWTDTKK